MSVTDTQTERQTNTSALYNQIGGRKLTQEKGCSVYSGCEEFSNDENDSQSVWDL